MHVFKKNKKWGDYMEKAIEETKRLIDQTYEGKICNSSYSDYCKVYLCTNELVHNYLIQNEFKSNEKALSVLSSGDHAFNLVANGLRDIDTFDINYLTEYYALGFKRALIIRCSYIEYIGVMQKILNDFTPAEEIQEIIKDTIPYIDEEYRKYWKEILEHYHKLEKQFDYFEKKYGYRNNVFQMFGISTRDTFLNLNSYTFSESAFNKFKNNLMKSNITFRHADAYTIQEVFPHKSYNYILLSNIIGYLRDNSSKISKEPIKRYVESIKQLIDENGIIYLYYSFLHSSNDFDHILESMLMEDEFVTCDAERIYLKRVRNGKIVWKD